MSELNWQELRVGMLKNGIAPKYARRTILELKSHFAELKGLAIDEGLSEIARLFRILCQSKNTSSI